MYAKVGPFMISFDRSNATSVWKGLEKKVRIIQIRKIYNTIIFDELHASTLSFEKKSWEGWNKSIIKSEMVLTSEEKKMLFIY